VADERGVILLELKYCESCGGLWVRPRGMQIVECKGCKSQTGNFAFRRKNAVATRMPRPASNVAEFCDRGGRA
jgi:ribosomal protein L37AE/L43A